MELPWDLNGVYSIDAELNSLLYPLVSYGNLRYASNITISLLSKMGIAVLWFLWN